MHIDIKGKISLNNEGESSALGRDSDEKEEGRGQEDDGLREANENFYPVDGWDY